jgi:phage baseplate assembly protein gpV
MTTIDQRFGADILEHVKERYYGKYRGTVIDVDAATLRIKAKVPAVQGGIATGWCMPCVPYAGNGVGFAFLPEKDAGVWIEFEAGNPSQPVWVGCYWSAGQTPPDATPTVKAIVTAKGAKLLFDDDAQTITLTDGSNNKVTLDSSGITLERGANKVVVSDSNVSVNDGAMEVM